MAAVSSLGAKPAGSDFVRLGATHIFPLAHLDVV